MTYNDFYNNILAADREKNDEYLKLQSKLEETKTLIDKLQIENNAIYDSIKKFCQKHKFFFGYDDENLDKLLLQINEKKLFFRNMRDSKKIVTLIEKNKLNNKKLSELYIIQSSIKSKIDNILLPREISISDNVVLIDGTSAHDVTYTDGKNVLKDKMYLVHCTDFFPKDRMILSNSDGKRRFGYQKEVSDNCYVVKNYVSNRHTVHFTINDKVQNTGDGKGSWDDSPKFIVVEPLLFHEDELTSGIVFGDTFIDHSVQLSNEAILLVRDDVYNELSDSDKNNYNIVRYTGNGTVALHNLLNNIGAPIIKNDSNNAVHAHSVQYSMEQAINIRDCFTNLVLNNDASIDSSYLTPEEIALFYNFSRGLVNGIGWHPHVSTDAINKFSKACNVSSEFSEFLFQFGIVRDGDKFRLLSYDDTQRHLDDSKFYIDNIKKSEKGVVDVLNILDSSNFDSYAISSGLNADIANSDDINVGYLQCIKNKNILKEMVNRLNIPQNHVIVLREDGLYLASKNKANDYIERDDMEIFIASNNDKTLDVINNFTVIKDDLLDKTTGVGR